MDDEKLKAMKWHSMDHTMAASITACTDHPGQVFKVPTSTITGNLTAMPGLTGCYVSGFLQATTLTLTVSGLGAFVLERHADGTGKGYTFEFAMDGQGKLWYHEVPKIKPDHHFKIEDGINIDALSSKSPYHKTL